MNTARPFLCLLSWKAVCLENCENSTQSGWAISSSSATTSGNSTERERWSIVQGIDYLIFSALSPTFAVPSHVTRFIGGKID
ncbi:hypothetical protein RCL_jg26565.t1 [Rhizophagus clarus]|uniref:Secreted protein n=1 Tax=Rhizophagus clarus TaxID=94130 RepID=A0A8H3QQG3_9GLOM|nr:hypothetical protein RCL_jg26565.t1 [Rhizophagus clarus]